MKLPINKSILLGLMIFFISQNIESRIMDNSDCYSPKFLRTHSALKKTPDSHPIWRILKKQHPLKTLESTTKNKKLSKSIDLSGFCDLVRNQGRINSCTAHSTATAMYVHVFRKMKKKIPFSRLFIYYNSRAIENSIPNDIGIAHAANVLLALQRYGSPPEKSWPYINIEQRFDDQPPPKAFSEALNYRYTDSTITPVPRNIRAFREVLSQGKPIITGLKLYESFFDDYVTLTGQVKTPKPNGQDDFVCSHSMLIVGYNDKTKKFKVRNSWGPEWGNHGYCFIPYGYILSNLAWDFYTINSIGKVKPSRSRRQ